MKNTLSHFTAKFSMDKNYSLSEYDETKSESTEILDQSSSNRDQVELPQIIAAKYSSKLDHVVLQNPSDANLLKSKGFGSKNLAEQEQDEFFLYDYEVLYLLYTG